MAAFLNHFSILSNPIWCHHPAVKIKAIASAVDNLQATRRIGIAWAQIPPLAILQNPASQIIGTDPALLRFKPPF